MISSNDRNVTDHSILNVRISKEDQFTQGQPETDWGHAQDLLLSLLPLTGAVSQDQVFAMHGAHAQPQLRPQAVPHRRNRVSAALLLVCRIFSRMSPVSRKHTLGLSAPAITVFKHLPLPQKLIGLQILVIALLLSAVLSGRTAMWRLRLAKSKESRTLRIVDPPLGRQIDHCSAK